MRLSSPLLVCTALGLAARCGWVLYVQPPGDTRYSDMGGYTQRALWALDGTAVKVIDQICFPPGAHLWYAAQMAVVGAGAWDRLGLLHALASAAVVPLVLASARGLPAWPLGLLLALWHPLLTYTGYFSSETPFTFWFALSLFTTVRATEASAGRSLAWSLAAGLAGGVAYLIRPAVLPGLGLAALVLAPRRPHVLASLVPLLLVVSLGAWRYREVTGEVGLLANSGDVMSFFAHTDYKRLEAVQVRADGTERVRRFHPPARTPDIGLTETFHFQGHSCDRAPLRAERDRVWAASTWAERLGRLLRNVRLLAWDNRLWPERNQAKDTWRDPLLTASQAFAAWGLVPAALLGLTTLRTPLQRLAAAHVAGLVLAALLYTGELRYRVPYDPLLIVLALGFLVRLGGARRARGPSP